MSQANDTRQQARVPFTEETVRAYLESCIAFLEKAMTPSNCLITPLRVEVYRSVLSALFGDLPSGPEDRDLSREDKPGRPVTG